MLRRYRLLLGLLVLVFSSARAHAQTSGTTGIRLGDALVLHLGAGLEFDFDSNVFYVASGGTSAFSMRVTPAFDLTNRPRQARRKVEFDLRGGLNYLEYLTSDPTLSALRQFGVDAGVQAAFFPADPYNFVLFDNYTRTTQPPYEKLSYNLDRDTNEIGARVNLSPGGGRLTFNIGYIFGIDYWEPFQLQDFDLMYHRFDVRASWRFFPKTAVYIAASEILNLYQHPGSTDHPDSYPLHVEAGVQGLITTKLTLNAYIGYTNGFYVFGPNPSEPMGGLSLSWKPTILSTGTLGYRHDFVNSTLGSYYDLDTAYLSWTQLIWRFTGFVRFSYANERFNGICVGQTGTGASCQSPSAETVSNRTDNLITLNVRIDYPFKNWLIGSIGDDLQANISNGQLNLGTAPGTVPTSYTKDVVYIGIRANY
jgi:hypothetical protein